MAVQATPPIQLDPSMDQGHQLAFINQNFNNIASVIGQNSFVIVNSGTSTMPIASATMTAAVMSYGTATTTIAHNLGYAPIVLGFTTSLGGSPTSNILPFINTTGGVLGGATFQDVQTFQVGADATNIYLYSTIQVWWSTATTRTDTTSSWNCKYYILQQTSNS